MNVSPRPSHASPNAPSSAILRTIDNERDAFKNRHGGAWGQFEGVSCGGSCGRAPCPPKFHHHFEGQPKLKYKRACPKPVCNPCDLENWGYYQTCWRPWPCPPNWSHCPVPPPGVTEPCPPEGAPVRSPDMLPSATPGQQMPYVPSNGTLTPR